jgi:hypothetical protein
MAALRCSELLQSHQQEIECHNMPLRHPQSTGRHAARRLASGILTEAALATFRPLVVSPPWAMTVDRAS